MIEWKESNSIKVPLKNLIKIPIKNFAINRLIIYNRGESTVVDNNLKGIQPFKKKSSI